MPVFQGRTMHRFRPAELVIATGSIEQPLVFGNNDLPGVMLAAAPAGWSTSSGSCRASRPPWSPPSEEGIEAALDLADGGVNVVAVADTREGAAGSGWRTPASSTWPASGRWQAKGSKAVTGVVVTARRRAPHAGLRPAA